MKTLVLLTVMVAMVIPEIATWGQVYTAITKDNAVDRVGLVQVKESKDMPKQRLITLDQIDASIAALQQSIADLEALKAKVKAEAEKVKLQKAE